MWEMWVQWGSSRVWYIQPYAHPNRRGLARGHRSYIIQWGYPKHAAVSLQSGVCLAWLGWWWQGGEPQSGCSPAEC